QPIPVEPEEFDEEHKIDLCLGNTDWPRYWSELHGKLYLLTPEQRQRQIRVGRERHGPLIPRRGDDDAGPSTRPRQSPGPSSVAMQSPGPTRPPTQSPDPAVQPMIPMQPPF
ncbi:hypothetical protein Gohar_028394, partial [Gossypium harknessii]|nr:hypothetical protein [Gossypium harknessii]